MKPTTKLAPIVLCAAGLMGCPPQDPEATVALVQLTAAPPTRNASLIDSEEEKVIRLSTGVAMGVGCWASCPDDDRVTPGEECATFNVTSGDGAVVEVLDVFRNDGTPAKALTAVGPGTTTITIRTPCGRATYQAIID